MMEKEAYIHVQIVCVSDRAPNFRVRAVVLEFKVVLVEIWVVEECANDFLMILL